MRRSPGYHRSSGGPRAPLVVEDVRGIEMGELDDTARRLLREMGYQAQGNPTLDVLPREQRRT